MTQIQLRRGTASAWTSADPILALGEAGIETNTGKFKIGNGTSLWSELPYIVTAWADVTGKPTVIAAGATKADARAAIDAAGLDESGLVPSNQLPSYVDDVLEYADSASFPATGETGKIYIALDTGRSWRWSGSTYAEIIASPGTTDAITEGSTNLYFTNTRADDRADARISAAVGVSVQAWDADLDDWAGKTAPDGAVVGTTDTQTLSAKTLTNPTVTGYTESAVAVGTVGATHTIDLTNGTVQTATLTASTATTFTMPTAAAGKSFLLILTQADPTGAGTATFTDVLWPGGEAFAATADAGAVDVLTFVSDGTSWFGSSAGGFA